MKTQTPKTHLTAKFMWWLAASLVFFTSRDATIAGWVQLATTAPAGAGHMLLLSDGTVMVQHADDTANNTVYWYRLTPDSQGSYVKGSWSTLKPSHQSRVFYESFVIPDGRVVLAGGEYGSGKNDVEVYDPVANSWTSPLPSPAPIIRDGCSELLPDGRLLVFPNTYVFSPPYTNLFYDPKANSWSLAPPSLGSQDEASWIKLPDDSILTIDRCLDNHNNDCFTNTERYVPSLSQWIPDTPLPPTLRLWSSVEIGAALLLPNGKAFFIGGSGQTGIYTPSGTTNPGTWTRGATIPNGYVSQDGSAAMEVNGRVLCVVHLPGTNNDPPKFLYEYNYLTDSFATDVPSPTAGWSSAKPGANRVSLLALPDGNVLLSDTTTHLYVYTPNPTAPVAVGKPTINSITPNADGSYLLTGTGLNGISAGAAFGDDGQMNSNYPLVRLTDGSGQVYYARTYDWSSTGVRTGSRVVSTRFTVPASLPLGTYSLVAVANGISSDPVSFYGPVWVDFNYVGVFQFGTYLFPYVNLTEGVNAVPTGGTVKIRTAGVSSETLTISKPMSIVAAGGPATIGKQ